jgi:hypothetical protein
MELKEILNMKNLSICIDRKNNQNTGIYFENKLIYPINVCYTKKSLDGRLKEGWYEFVPSGLIGSKDGNRLFGIVYNKDESIEVEIF